MAKLTTESTHTLKVSAEELELIRKGLRSLIQFGNVYTWDPARDLLADLSED